LLRKSAPFTAFSEVEVEAGASNGAAAQLSSLEVLEFAEQDQLFVADELARDHERFDPLEVPGAEGGLELATKARLVEDEVTFLGSDR
jgi:hypothetical protein